MFKLTQATLAVLTTLIILAICFIAGVIAYGPNAGGHTGYGYFGVAVPCGLILVAFLLGRSYEVLADEVE
jgi:hypothetical protein